jgi:hypothetical protein
MVFIFKGSRSQNLSRKLVFARSFAGHGVIGNQTKSNETMKDKK